ncbi:hypothetical protein CEXT_220651 [Caerostris extrusa]|uniref:Uncharacterized protein n=1 Tax=Caerostris extrusa TaxID=172846 RepID=A0AAV4VBN9_CAEEX|nr:hypothetical protein CEXT_220651 [Caerostris extrusa]
MGGNVIQTAFSTRTVTASRNCYPGPQIISFLESKGTKDFPCNVFYLNSPWRWREKRWGWSSTGWSRFGLSGTLRSCHVYLVCTVSARLATFPEMSAHVQPMCWRWFDKSIMEFGCR